MGKLADLRDAPAGPVNAHTEVLTDELAACLERFLEGTADEGTLSRGRRALEAWHVLHGSFKPNGALHRDFRP